jgi:hypothetical protein
LHATLAGLPPYRAYGFEPLEEVVIDSGGVPIPSVHKTRPMGWLGPNRGDRPSALVEPSAAIDHAPPGGQSSIGLLTPRRRDTQTHVRSSGVRVVDLPGGTVLCATVT